MPIAWTEGARRQASSSPKEDRTDDSFVEYDHPGAIDADIVRHELRRVRMILTEESAVCPSQSEALERVDIVGPERPQRQSPGS
jgi:hypothetical protein